MIHVELFSDLGDDFGPEPVALIELPDDVGAPPQVVVYHGRAFALGADSRYREVTCFHACSFDELEPPDVAV